MIHLELFQEIAEVCENHPFVFLPKEKQDEYIAKLKKVLEKMKSGLEKKGLELTHAYQIIESMYLAVSDGEFDGVRFANSLAQLDTLYGPKTKPDLMEKIRRLDVFAERFKKRANEFYLYESRIEKAIAEMAAEAIQEHDAQILDKVGSFYVLEYTLTVMQQLEKLTEEEQWGLLRDGKNLDVGNLPGLLPLMGSFRQEFAFNLFDKDLRWDVLRVFYDTEHQFESEELADVKAGLKAMNIGLLKVLQKGGMQVFKGLVYKPYPNDTPVEQIIAGIS